MDDNKLNYNRPLLSVRRRSSTMGLYEDDKRKTENFKPFVSRPPPYRSELNSGPIRNPGAVPFLWESAPGQPKDEIRPQMQNCDRPPIVPKLPPGRYPKAKAPNFHKVSPTITDNKSRPDDVLHDSRTSPSVDRNVNKSESNNETTEDLETSDSGDSDEAYVDALDTLSRTESFMLNCTVSGLSGIDDLDGKPSGSFSRDLQTREFMMDRFLPAAKAMAPETPKYVKMQSVVREQTQVKKILNQDRPSLRYGPSFTEQYSHNQKREDDEEESDDEYDRRGSMPAVCGLLPQFCLKSSLCLLNPVPAMSMRTQVPKSSSNKLKPVSSSTVSCSKMRNQLSKSDVSKRQSVDKIQAAQFEEIDTSLRDERNQLESHSASTYSDAPLSFLEENELLQTPEKPKHFQSDKKGLFASQKLLADKEFPNELDSGAPVVKQTVHVDNAQEVECENSRSFSLNVHDTRGVPSSREEQEIIINRMDQMHAVDSYLKLYRYDDTIGCNGIASSIDKSNKDSGMETQKSFGGNQDLSLDFASTQNIELADSESSKSLERKLPRTTSPEKSNQIYSKFPVPPPLPKSPSDSWLCRTLPSMSMKNGCRHSYLGASTNHQNQLTKASKGNFKWETIVKSTNVQREHLRISEELLMHIPET